MSEDLAVKDTDIHLNCAVGQLKPRSLVSHQERRPPVWRWVRRGWLLAVVIRGTGSAVRRTWFKSWLTFTSYITLDKLVNLSRPQFPQSCFQIKSEKLQESPGTKTIITAGRNSHQVLAVSHASRNLLIQFVSDGEIRGSGYFHAKQGISEAQIYVLSQGAISATLFRLSETIH